jgi:lipase chaperone LimK
LRKSGVSGEDLRRERERRWGEDVARRLEELEKARAQWDRRLADFRQSRATLLRDPSLGPEERSSAIAALLSRDFTPEEQLRVLALDRLQGEGPGRPPEGP